MDALIILAPLDRRVNGVRSSATTLGGPPVNTTRRRPLLLRLAKACEMLTQLVHRGNSRLGTFTDWGS